MIPIQNNKPTEIIKDYDVIRNQKEVIKPKFLENRADERLKLTDYLDSEILIKKYLLSFQPRLIGSKAFSFLNAFRGRNSNQIDGKKSIPLVVMPNRKPKFLYVFNPQTFLYRSSRPRSKFQMKE